jgi:hypothetical protein
MILNDLVPRDGILVCFNVISYHAVEKTEEVTFSKDNWCCRAFGTLSKTKKLEKRETGCVSSSSKAKQLKPRLVK